ncbi:PIN domain-containing protein, partial [Anaerobaca lacustris]|nr:PIN domain-containing protein [Sedimentisphaerales bacterium M17dextr]
VYSVMKKRFSEVKKDVEDLTLRLQKMLGEPGTNDPVYTTLEGLFSKNDRLALHEASPERAGVVQRAHDRFLLGYPPRKKADTSFGDSINWEWLIQIASQEALTVYVVSRDADYGVSLQSEYHLNDWLKEEFSRRAKKGASIHLMGVLSEALKQFSVSVSKAQQVAEQSIMRRRSWTERAGASGRYIDYLRSLSEEDRERELDSKIADTHYSLGDEETVCGLMATTNTAGWDNQEYEILDVQVEHDVARVRIWFRVVGEPDRDRPFCGDTVSGTAVAEIDRFGNVTYSIEEANVEDHR